jgi:hypothetical protein
MSNGTSPEARLAELGIELPVPPTLPFTPRLKPVGVHRGVCARCAIGVAELPSGLAVEVEALVALVG